MERNMDWNKYLNSERLRDSTRKVDSRNNFESDYGRVLFSPALRRMHDKTQVFPLTADDNIHSRLTHSMEVMAIGHSLGIKILRDKQFVNSTGRELFQLEREIPIILQNACLVHDIGNPPFGHFGETVIKDYFKKLFKEDEINEERKFKLTTEEKSDFTLFDGNAQGLRILTKLQVLDDAYGLNLTFATLGTYIKYPNFGSTNKNILKEHKRGVFQSEKEYFEIIANKCNLKINGEYIRHPLAFLMEAADSICYLCMDIEDGFNKNWYEFDDLKRFFKKVPSLKKFLNDLSIKHKGSKLEVTKMVKLRIEIINRLVELATDNFLKNLDSIYKGTYQNELIFDDKDGLAITLKEFCDENILPNREILSLEMTGHSVLKGLLDYYTTFLFHSDKKYRDKGKGMISNSIIRAALIENKAFDFDKLRDYYKLRVIVDYISGMTDQFALNHFQKISGQKIN